MAHDPKSLESLRANYHQEVIWWKKVLYMHLYHVGRRNADRKWTITKTAYDFGCSIGLVSENNRLAEMIAHDDSVKTKYNSRDEAIKHLPRKHKL